MDYMQEILRWREMKMNLRFILFTLAAIVFYPSTAHAYVDPGLVSMVIQGIFVAAAGFTTLYVLGPWRRFKSLFTKSQPSIKTKSQPSTKSDTQPASEQEL